MSDQPKNWKWLTPAQYFRRLWHWFLEGKLFWILLIATFAIIFLWLRILPECYAELERYLRVSGMVLQLVGFLVTIYGINSTFLDLGMASIPKRIVGYFMRMPILPIGRIIRGEAHLEAGSFKLTGHGATVEHVGNSLEERVKNLEDRTKKLRRDLKDLTKDLKQAETRSKEEIERVKYELAKMISDIRERYDKLFEGGAVIEILGVVLFAVGVVLASVSPEIAIWMGSSECTLSV